MGAYRINTIITVIATVALLPVAMLPILARVSRRYGALRGWPMVAGVGLLGSSVALAAFTVFPLPDPDTLECSGEAFRSTWQTDPFASISLIGDVWQSAGFVAAITSSAFAQVFFNVLLFVPYGFFLHQVTRWRAITVVIVGLATSLLIELTQGTAVFGRYACPYRLFDVDDLFLNTLGAAIGVLVSVAVARFAWSRPEPVADMNAPSIARRVLATGIDLGLMWVIAAILHIAWAGPDVVLLAIGAGVVAGAVPLVRGDRATVGQAVVNIAPVRGPSLPDAPSGAALAVRWVVRWLPLVVFPALTAMVGVAELATVLTRKDGASLAGLAARTTTQTKPEIMAKLSEQKLVGGNMTGAVRRADVVLKPTQPQSETIQRLVAHVRAQGALWTAEPLGIEHGRDMWRFIPGEVSHDDLNDSYPNAVIEDVARRLRQWHDATETFERTPNDVWWWPGKVPAEVICYVDFAPYNHVYRDGSFVGAIDFDVCYPGPRLWDLAYTAYRYVPLTPSEDAGLVQGRLERLGLFLAAYAAEDARLLYPASDLLGFVEPRLVAMADWCDQQESPDRKRDGEMYRAHAEWITAGGYGEVRATTVPDL